MTSFGERVDEAGNVVVPPVAVAGVQWDRDLIKEEGLASGRYKMRSIIVDNPKIFGGANQFGYDWATNNCTTYAIDAWHFYSGERGLVIPHPAILQGWIERRNSAVYGVPLNEWQGQFID